MLFKLSLRELRRSWQFGLFFIFNLSLGLAGFIALQAFNEALTQEIKLNAKSILSADLAVSSRRELSAEEIKKIETHLPVGTQSGKIYEFFAMLNSEKGSRLILLKGVDQSYPFYGQLEFFSGKTIKQGDEKEILGTKKVWVYPEIRDQLGLVPGDKVNVGNLELTISDVIEKDATQTFRMASVAPRIFIDLNLLPQSGLLQYGSTFSLAQLYKFPLAVNSTEIRDNIFRDILDPQIRVETPETAGEDSGRQLGYLSDYLGLVSIVALFMSALGAAYIYRLFLSSRMKEIAIFRTLGLQSYQSVGVFVIQASLLGLLAVVPTVAASFLILPLLTKLLQGFTPFDLEPVITTESLVICVLMAVVGSFVVTLPFLVKILDLKPSKLFNEEKFSSGIGKLRVWTYLPAGLLFYILAIIQAKSWKVGSLFIVTLLGVVIFLSLVGFAAVKSAKFFGHLKQWNLKYSFLSLSRRSVSSLAVFIALGVGALLINILPQIKSSLQTEFSVDRGTKIPSLFMFDVQDDQVQGLNESLKELGVESFNHAPMVRARILNINGAEYERALTQEGFKTREEENEARFRNRGMNLSYRPKLSSSEFIVSGKDFSGTFDSKGNEPAELSVEKKFAERIGLKIGDRVLFDVQGLEVEGKVINLRKVKWTSFQPNFFVLFQPGVLDDAPKTWVASVPFVESDLRAKIQSDIVRKFPNISIIDVVRTVEDALKTAEKMSWSLELMAGLALITGYIVLFSIVRSQIKMRRWELNMLKILGSDLKSVTIFVLVEFAYLSFVASFVGSVLSILMSFVLNVFIFESDFVLNFVQPLLSVLLITGISLIVAFFASWNVAKENPLSILREEV